jgi:hypothetical protein
MGPGLRPFAKLAKTVAAVKKYAPGKLAHMNLCPNYATLGAPEISQLGAAANREYLERCRGRTPAYSPLAE